jgi:hypothetical protein
MQPDVDAKIARLRDEGLIATDEDLPQEYASVVDSLHPDELETLISVRKRLAEASRTSGVDESAIFFAP